MPTVRYEAPRSVSDAVRLMQSDPEARVLAGGTDLLIQFRAGLQQPSAFIDVKLIPELVDIAVREDGIRIGASAPATAICEHATITQWWPGLVEAVHLIGSTQIQGRASIGGNLCNASPAADSICALIANRAACIIAGSGGERRVPVEQFCLSPGRTVLQPGELLIAVDLPRPQPGTSDAYLRLIPRTEMDIAVVGAGVSLTLDQGGRCTAARVAIGAVAPTALLVAAAGDALIGSTVDDDALARAADLARAAARPIDDKRGTAAYRRHVVGVLVKRAAASAAARAKGPRA
jgi:carbon-monoxide dehydrogenase medium subunit